MPHETDQDRHPVGSPDKEPSTRIIANNRDAGRQMRTVGVPDHSRGTEPVKRNVGGPRNEHELHPVPLPFDDKARREDLKGNVRHRVPQRFLGERGYKFPRDMEETSNDG